MKKQLISLAVLGICSSLLMAPIYAAPEAETKGTKGTKGTVKTEFLQLPTPQKQGGMPLMEALAKRRATRSFSEKKISNQTLSDLLWATWGINRENGHRTSPTAHNNQDIQVYVANAAGVWRYHAEKEGLEPILSEDFTKRFKAPLTFIYASPEDRLSLYPIGALFQNAGLYSASVGLNNVVRDQYNNILYGKFPLPEGYKIQITQSFGWPK